MEQKVPTIKFRNKRTGEIKEVPVNETQSYGLNPQDALKRYEAQAQLDRAAKGEDLSLTEEEKKKKQVKSEIEANAQALIDVINMGREQKLTGKQYEDALKFTTSRYAASSGFSEGGKTLTGSELGILAGSMPKIRPPRKQNWLEKPFGWMPAAEGEVLDDEQTLYNKALLALGRGEELQSQQGQPTMQSNRRDMSLGGFAENVGRDLGENIQGIVSIPGLLMNALRGKVNLPEAGAEVGKGIFNEYKDLVTDPINTTYDRPVSSLLNVLPFLGAAGKLSQAGRAGKAAKIADTAGDVAKVAKTASNPTIDSILKAAGQAGSRADDASSLSKNIYQSALNISKKGNSFERLKPNETVGQMIKYGIKGNTDDIAAATEKVTGQNGILSNVVNNAIADVKAPVKLDRVFNYLKEAKGGRFSALGSDKIDEVSTRLTRIPQGKEIGDIEASKLLDVGRKLEAEAVAHRIAGSKGDTLATELGQLKMEVADEIVAVIDEAVEGKGNIQAYKDPRIIEELTKVSPKLAKDFKNAKSISELRSLQKPFVRMSKIIQLSQNEPSSLGQKLFRSVGNIPVLGPILDAGAQNLAVPAATSTAVGLEKSLPFLRPKLKQLKRNRIPPLTILGREYNESTQ